MNKTQLLLQVLLCAIVLSACSGNKDQPAQEDIENASAEVLYSSGAKKLDDGDDAGAELLFDSVERLHPYSKWAPQAELMKVYSAYKDARYDESLDGAQQFIALHPANKDVDYAWYLRALSYYMQIGDVSRDQKITRQAAAALNDVTARFPDSKYARDAKIKMDLTLDHMAGHEMEVGRFYLKAGHLGAAMGRFRVVVDQYQTTTHTPEALYRLVEIYLKLGMNDEATRMAAILGHNYPGGHWYARAYKLMQPNGIDELNSQRSWVDKTADGLLGGE